MFSHVRLGAKLYVRVVLPHFNVFQVMMFLAHSFPKFLVLLSFYERYPAAHSNTINVIRLAIFRFGQTIAVFSALEKKFSCAEFSNDYCRLCLKVR